MEQSGAQARQQEPLSAAFFNRDASVVARELLGKLLVRRYGRELLAGRVVEAEAYLGQIDPAAHAFAGKTPRNAVLFGPPGIAYVYFIYGNHYCLNVSCMPEGNAGCVLFRALEPVAGIEQMVKARAIDLAKEIDRKKVSFLKKLSSGPGRLSEALKSHARGTTGKTWQARAPTFVLSTTAIACGALPSRHASGS